MSRSPIFYLQAPFPEDPPLRAFLVELRNGMFEARIQLERHDVSQTIEWNGDTWWVIGVGRTNEGNFTFCLLASTTRSTGRRNGESPRQLGAWIPNEVLGVIDGYPSRAGPR